MRILLDNSNLFSGGGVQVALSFLYDLLKVEIADMEFVVVQSFGMKGLLNTEIFPVNFTFIQLGEREQKSIFWRSLRMKRIEKEYLPNAVFTTFGPSYYKSKCFKIVGFAIPHIIYPNSPYFDKLSTFGRIKNKVLSILKTFFFRRKSDVLIFESEEANLRFSRIFNKPTYTVNNALNEVFYDKERWGTKYLDMSLKSVPTILSIAANYPHKNLEIIPQVIDELLNKGFDSFQFVLSLNIEDIDFDSKYDSYIKCIGKVAIEDVPLLYKDSDILFMPTLLEVFSTSYLEAMFMEVPIVASNLPFAIDVCGDAALYCEPLNAESYASSIFNLLTNNILKEDLIAKGKVRFENFGKSLDRTEKYLEIINNTINANTK